jgi:antitoxin (DNA-binding transcriptional repressor) of toxin-antitoxin stability system
MATVTIHAAQDSLPQLVARAEAGEEIVLSRGEEPVAKIVPIQPKAKKRQFGALKGKISIGPEFFEPLPDDELKAWDQ